MNEVDLFIFQLYSTYFHFLEPNCITPQVGYSLLQAIIQLMGGLSTYLLSTPKLEGPVKLATSTIALGLISLIIGELGIWLKLLLLTS